MQMKSPWQMMDQEAMPEATPIAQAFAQDLSARKQYVNQLRDQLAAAPKTEQGFDINTANLKPLLAYADSLVGTRTAQSYEAPKNKKEIEMMKLQQLADKEQQSIADDQINYLKLQELNANNADKNDLKAQFLEAYKTKIGLDARLGRDKLNDQASKAEKLPEGAYNAAGFLREGEMAESNLSKLLEKGFMGPSRMDQLRGLVNEAQSPDAQLFNQAVSQFANAKIRPETGASISDTERADIRRNYFPMPGDTPAVIQQKALARKQVLESLRGKARGAEASIPKIFEIGGAGVPTAEVTVTNGKETLTIPRADLKEAIREGFREVK